MSFCERLTSRSLILQRPLPSETDSSDLTSRLRPKKNAAAQEIFTKTGNFFGDDLVYTGKTTRGVGG